MPHPGRIRYLKNYGHKLLDEWVALSTKNRDSIYLSLARKMHVDPPKAHFSKMRTEATLMRAISIIESQVTKLRKHHENRQKYHAHKLSLEDQQKAFKVLKELNNNNIWAN